MDLGPTTIAAIYKDRWQIEIFFKYLKQNLKIKTFVGTSANAVKIQIWRAPGETWEGRKETSQFLKPFTGTQRVKNPARLSVPAAGTECCAGWGNLCCEAYTGSLQAV
jgi:hypothetical protein